MFLVGSFAKTSLARKKLHRYTEHSRSSTPKKIFACIKVAQPMMD